MRLPWVLLWVFVVALGCGGSVFETDDAGAGGSGNAGGAGGSGGTAGSGGMPSGGSGGMPMGGSGGTSGAAGAAWDSCGLTSQCVVRPESCCGDCGAATRDDIIALNQDYVQAYASNNCANVDCPGCYAPTDPTLLATCSSGSCTVVDLMEHPSTECLSADDCRIRTNDCCECNGGVTQEHLIAINIAFESAFSSLVCDPVTACPDCMPVYPENVKADCVAGRCVAVW